MPATVNLAPLAKLRFVDNNGVPLAGGKVFTYAPGSTTKQATYTDAGGATPNPNPVILDSRGEAAIWFDQTLAYKVTLSPQRTPTRPRLRSGRSTTFRPAPCYRSISPAHSSDRAHR
jgi:hypothetical protein